MATIGGGGKEEEFTFEFVTDDGVIFVGVDGELFLDGEDVLWVVVGGADVIDVGCGV